MRLGKRIVATVTTVGLAASTPITAAAAQGAEARQGNAPAQVRTVTLLTGDQVMVPGGKARPWVVPGKGRQGVVFDVRTVRDRLHVIPADARPLVASGKLDRRLFDVTGLLEAGYDRGGELPLIVTGAGAGAQNQVAGTRVTLDLPSVGGRAVAADKAALPEAWRALAGGDGRVWLDGPRRASLDRSTAQIGAPTAWQQGVTGEGVVVAVLDTGVDETHPDLDDRQIAERNFSDAADAVDRVGHGTHVASTIAGADARYRGVAHGARLLDGKVLDDRGFGMDSWIIAGMQWAVEQGADIVNLSLGGGDTPEVDPVEEAVNRLSAEHGALFVIAAGNSGPSRESVGSPASADAALAVGSVERDDSVSPFSSRGPRVGDGGLKPEITAPGSGIVAAKAGEGQIGDPVGDGHVALSGTSMATPHVAGAAALLAQRHPDWTGAQLKAALMASARPTPGAGAFAQGAGRVDVPRALAQTLTSEPTSVGLGVQRWPHNDDTPVTKEFSYRNAGDRAVTLELSIEVVGPDGAPVPEGMFTLSTTRVEVPAGGAAAVRLTADTRLGAADGEYSGAVVARAGEMSARTPFAVDREVESYDVTVTYLGPDGLPAPDAFSFFIGIGGGSFRSGRGEGGVLTVRLPKGRYVVDSIIDDRETTRGYFMPYPAFEVTGETAFTVDARQAKPIRVTPPDPAAALLMGETSYMIEAEGWGLVSGFLTDDLDLIRTAHLGPELPAEQFVSWVNTAWQGGSDRHNLAHFQEKVFPTGFDKTYTARDVSTIRASLAQATPGSSGLWAAVPVSLSGRGSGISPLLPVSLPSTVTDHYSTETSQWSTVLLQLGPDGGDEALLESGLMAMRPGRTYAQRFNTAVFGPALPRTSYPWAERSGNTLYARVGLFGDGSGNAGWSLVGSGRTTLDRNGVRIGESPHEGGGVFEVPAEAGDYRLATEAVRGARFDLSTRVEAAWTFRSAAGQAGVPLSVVRFHALLDESNSAPAGRYLLPVTMQREDGSSVVPRELSVQVSYDRGGTWAPARLLARSLLVLDHPAGAGSVSLKAKGVDPRGGTVEQTIIDAYKLGKR